MIWIYRNHRPLRVGLLVLLFVALLGPWAFDTIYVPLEYAYACSAPFIRLNENLCGKPLSGMRILFWVTQGFANVSTGLLSGAANGFEWARELLFCLLLFTPVAPFFSTALLLQRGHRRRRQGINLIAWALAGAAGLVMVLSYMPDLPPVWAQWGVWLVIGLAVGALMPEGVMLAAGRRPGAV